MTTHEVANWFDGLRTWLGDALNKKVANSLGEVSAAFRELPEKPFKDFVKDMKSLNGSVAALIEEIKTYRGGQGGNLDTLIGRIDKLKSPDLKELAKEFALPTKRTLAENKELLRAFVANGSHSKENGMPAAAEPQIEEGLEEYYRLKNSLSSLSIDDLRARFEHFRRYSPGVLQGIAARLGYHFRGGKDDVFKKLLQTLEGLKMSQVHGEIIGRS